MKKLNNRFWWALVIFGLMGQVAWTIENMYFNVFIYKMFHATAVHISIMVGASAFVATVTTILIGTLSDYISKRKLIICGGYIAWGISILAFAFIRMDILTAVTGSTIAAASMGITLVIAMDCVMTFFGSSANDASFNAWLTDWGNDSNRGKIEGVNAMMPLVSILVVFGSFMAFNLDKAESWTTIYVIISCSVLAIGVLGFFLIEDKSTENSNSGSINDKEEKLSYWAFVFYSFRPSVVKQNFLLYLVIGAMALFNICIQIFMPYLILYYEKGLQMSNYILVMAPAILISSIITAFYGKVYDMAGFKIAVLPPVAFLMTGTILLFICKNTIPVFIGSLLLMTGILTGGAIFDAMIRTHTPENKAGQIQGIRIIGQVLIPGIIGPAIGAAVLQNAQIILNSDGTSSFLPNNSIFAASFVAEVVLLAALLLIFSLIKKGKNNLFSTEGEHFSKDRVWVEYPRPQLRRCGWDTETGWQSLNGIWQIEKQDILVPFPPQASLSEYSKKIKSHFTYRRAFTIPSNFTKEKIILHFGAVDQIALVKINGEKIGKHEGGYIPFSFDITQVVKTNKENIIEVEVTDTLSKDFPYGKQCKKRGGMWYTPVSGIWQSVWLENVNTNYIRNIKIRADLKGVDIQVEQEAQGFTLKIDLGKGNTYTLNSSTNQVYVDLTKITLKTGEVYTPVLWTCENPYLYPITIQTDSDQIFSYFGLRTISVTDVEGVPKVLLNEKPIFLHGVLDQGYFCDGIFLPAVETEYKNDILRMKELGFNMLRKHIKIEPAIFYYYCDSLGMLVFQDMVNNGSYHFVRDTVLPTFGFLKKDDTKSRVSKKRKVIFEEHMKDTIDYLHNHPSIIGYTIFNEGWGQFESDAMYQKAKKLDNSRLYDSTSGWFTQKESDFDSRHIYFKTVDLPSAEKRPLLVSECGGYSFVVKNHVYPKYANYGYGVCKTSKELTDTIIAMYDKMILSGIKQGVCGSVYTQLSDVEDETNGFYTYDRKVCKVEVSELKNLANRIFNAFN